MSESEKVNLFMLVVATLPSLGGLAISAVNGGKAWFNWKSSYTNEITLDGKIGRMLCLISVVLFIIMLIFFIDCIHVFIQEEQPSPEILDSTSISSIQPSSAPLEPEGYYVYEYQYGNVLYSGYVNPDTMIPNGKGTMIYSNQDKYSGYLEEGMRMGTGTMWYHNGDTYEGEWTNDLKNGQGVYSWENGRSYSGGYNDDKREGFGTFTGWVDETTGWKGTYTGQVLADNFEGQGTFDFDNGDKFKGEFKANKRWNGTYYSKDGSTYEIVNGEFK